MSPLRSKTIVTMAMHGQRLNDPTEAIGHVPDQQMDDDFGDSGFDDSEYSSDDESQNAAAQNRNESNFSNNKSSFIQEGKRVFMFSLYIVHETSFSTKGS